MENKPKTSSYKRLKPYIKGFQIPFVLAIFGAIISAVITVIGPDKLKEITNTITEGITPTKMGTIPGIDLDKVASIAMTLAVLYAISAIVGYLQSFTVATVTQRFSQRLRKAIQTKNQRVPLNYFDSHSQGDTLSRVTNDVDLLGQSLSQGLGTLITSSILLVAAIIMMFYSKCHYGFHCYWFCLDRICSSSLHHGFLTTPFQTSTRKFWLTLMDILKKSTQVKQL